MEKTEFLNGCDKIDKLFAQLTSKGTTVTDGVIDREAYFNAKPRLMFVLKEANSEDSWSYIDKFTKKDWLDRCNSLASIRRVIYTSYGILKSENKDWSDFPWSNEEECQSVLREIAFINIKKSPGGSTSNPTAIKEAYQKHRDLLKLQINTYDPDIIIFCNTMNFVELSDFKGLEGAECKISEQNNHYYYVNDKLYIHAYHPSYMKFTDEGYVMDIVNIFREWYYLGKR